MSEEIVRQGLLEDLASGLGELLSRRQAEPIGVECARAGHDWSDKIHAECHDVDRKWRVISLGVVCRICEGKLLVKDRFELRKGMSPLMLQVGEHETIKSIKQRLYAMDRNRKAKATNG